MNRNERKKLTGQLGRQRSKASRPVLGENAKAPLSARLRRRADEHLRKQRRGRKPGAGRQEAGAETQQLVHELQVHQVELEMQNEELQQVRAKAHALLARYTDLYDFAPVGYLTLNEPGLILEANLTAAKLLGVARSKLLQQPLTRFILREDLDIFYQHRQQLFETRAPQSCELRLTRPGGAPFWVHGEAILAQDHKTGAPVCRVTLSDLTERKQAEEALRESEHLFRVLFEQAAVGVAQVRSDTGQFLRINQKYCEIVGYSREEMERLDFQTITHPDDLAGDLANMELLKAGKIREFTMEKRYFRKDGSLVWANLSVSPLWAPGEPPSSHVAVVEDITDRKRAENELILRNLRAQALLDLHQMSAAPREQILGFVQDASLRLTQSDYAFLGLLDEAESVMTIHRSSKQVMAQCALSGQPNCLPISGAGLWAECVRQRQPVVVNDYSAPHPGKKGMPAEQVLIRRLLTVPIFDGGRIVAVVAVANKPEEYALADTHTLIFLGSKMWEILRRQQAAADRERLAQFERLAQLMKCASDIILLADEHGRILEANDRALETYGYSLAELRQKTLEDLRTPESRAELPHQMEQLEMDGRAVFEAMNQRRDGAAFPVEISARFLEIAGVRYRLGIVRDISERKRAEEALRNREGVLQRIFDLLPVGLWFADKNGKLLRGNPAGVKIWGAEPKVSPSEYGVFKARRLPSGEEVAPDDWALAHTIRDKVTIVDELLEIDAFDGKKKTILNYTAPVLDAQGEVQGAIVVNQDITERKHAAEALSHARDEWEDTFNSITDMITVHDNDFNIIHANKAARQILGLPLSGNQCGAKCFRHYHGTENPPAGCTSCTCLTTGLASSYELFEPHLNRHLEILAIPRFDRNHQLIGMIHVARDITERKRTEKRVQTFSQEIIAAREEERKQVSSALHHDVGSLTVGISAHLDAIEQDLRSGKPGEALKWMKRTRKLFDESVVRLKGLAVELRPPELDVLGLRAALRQYFSPAQKHGDARIHFKENLGRRRVPGGAATILFRVAQEALTNAITHGRAKQVDVDVRALKREITLTVHDNGKEFHPAEQMAQPTSQMGLRVMREMALSAGGVCTVESGRGKGTTVRVRLPIADCGLRNAD